MRAIEMVVMGLLGFVVLLLVVRPLVRRIITPDDRARAGAAAGGMLGRRPADRSRASRRSPAIASGDPR